ncbi:MAG: hypothetical protein LBC41_03385 [Clostridiales bacterium]|nr:hypothetical protein [Clostridiales bacterium]
MRRFMKLATLAACLALAIFGFSQTGFAAPPAQYGSKAIVRRSELPNPPKLLVALHMDGSKNKSTLYGFGNRSATYDQLESFIRQLGRDGNSLLLSVSSGGVLEDNSMYFASLEGDGLENAIAKAKEYWEEDKYPDGAYGEDLDGVLTLAKTLAQDNPAVLIFLTASTDPAPYDSIEREASLVEKGVPIIVLGFCESGVGATKIAVTPDDAAYLTRLAQSTGGEFFDIESTAQISGYMTQGIRRLQDPQAAEPEADAVPSPSATSAIPSVTSSPMPSQPAPRGASGLPKLQDVFIILGSSLVALAALVLLVKKMSTAGGSISRSAESAASSAVASGPSRLLMMQIITTNRLDSTSEILNVKINVTKNKQNMMRYLIGQRVWSGDLDFGIMEVRLGADGEIELRKPGDSNFSKWPSFAAVKLPIPSQPGTKVQFRHYRG